MSEYINFEIARKYLHEACSGLGSNGGLMLKIKFDQEPKADVIEVVHGEWIMINEQLAKCSVCGGYESTNGKDKTGKGVIFKMQKKFCPHCGADMRGGTE